MTPLASWLGCSWRHNGHGPAYAPIIAASVALDALIWQKHGIKLLFVDDAARFRDISTEEVKRAQRLAGPEAEAEFPQLGTHADPTCRALSSQTFYALIGTRTDRPLPLLTMNSASLFEPHVEAESMAALFTSRRLWSDHPARDCADLSVTFHSKRDDLKRPYSLPAVFLGTAWTTKHRRRQGIMETVSRLHRLVAWLRFGAIPQFGTIYPDQGHEAVFHGEDVGHIVETRAGLPQEIRVLHYPADAAVKSAEEINSQEA